MSHRKLANWLTCVLVLSASTVLALPPRYDHVVVVVEENRAESQIIGDLVNAPYLNFLATNGVILGSIFAIEHPSQPNYLQLFSGSNQGTLDDNLPPNFSTTPTATYPFTTPNLGAELVAAGFTFAGYAEEIESAGATDWADYDPHSNTNPGIYYRRKHVPWANWIAKVAPVPANQLTNTLNRAFTNFPANFSQLPTVSFVIPNQLHDMHDGSRKQGDDWLAANLNAYALWARTNNSLLIVTWDEDDYAQDNQIPTVLFGANLRNGTVTAGTWTLHNLLRTLEDMYGTTHAGSAAQVRPIVGPFTTDPIVSVATFRQGLNGYASARDTQLWQETPDTSYASAVDITADLDTGAAAGNQEGQVLVRFDNLFGAVAGQVPTNATILSAKLILNTPINTTGTDYDSDDTFRAHRMILDWADTATWNSLAAGVSADNVESASTASFSAVPDVDGGPTIFDVTADLEQFKAGTATNRGWVIRPSGGGTGDGWTFKSSEYATDPALRPTLEILYSVPTPPTPVTLVSPGSVWRYLDNGSDQGASWRSNNFNDAAWASGPAMLGYGDANGVFPRTTNSYGLDPNNKFITSYYRLGFYVPNPADVQSLNARMQRDDGAVVYLNGAEVWRNNLAAGTVTYQTRANATVSGSGETTWITTPFSPGALVTGTNVLAVEIHQDSTNSSDICFDFELTATTLFPTLPRLAVSRTGNTTRLTWPLAGSYFGAQFASNMIPPVTWTAITNAPVLTNGQWTVTLPGQTNAQRFFRLQTR